MGDENLNEATNNASEDTQTTGTDQAVQDPTPVAPTPEPVLAAPAPVAKPTAKPSSAKQQRAANKPTDTAVVATKAPEAPVAPTPAPAPEPVVEADPTDGMASLIIYEGDDPQVEELKKQLAVLVDELNRAGNEPENFKNAAQRALSVTRYVIQFPKVPVLDALLAFFEENIDGVCDPSVYLRGSTTLSNVDEQQVGFLYGLFADLARKQVIRTNSQLVVQILKKPEILNYYDRKVTYLAQVARG